MGSGLWAVGKEPARGLWGGDIPDRCKVSGHIEERGEGGKRRRKEEGGGVMPHGMLRLKMDVLMYASVSRFSSLRARGAIAGGEEQRWGRTARGLGSPHMIDSSCRTM